MQEAIALGTCVDEAGVARSNAVHTGDTDTGDQEQSALMRWDAAVLLLHVLVGVIDLTFRMRISIVQASRLGGWYVVEDLTRTGE